MPRESKLPRSIYNFFIKRKNQITCVLNSRESFLSVVSDPSLVRLYMPFCRQFPLPRQSANWHTFATAKMAKAAKLKHKYRPFFGAFPKYKMYLFIKFFQLFFSTFNQATYSARNGPKIGRFWANFQPKIYKNFLVSKSPIILPKFSQKLAENRPILGPIFAVFAICFCRGKRQRLSKPLPRQLPLPLACIVQSVSVWCNF